jgi:hypothetical protein
MTKNETLWYKDAIFYQVYIRAFYDSNGDGHGDIKGLIQKLDYLQELGVDCLWLMPIYPSPLRDDGYDIADYYNIAERFGTLEDFKELLNEAHARNLRIIMDLVLNHTSDEHPWFQASRSDRNSPYRDYYVWSDTDQKYKEARIIFLDTDNIFGTAFMPHNPILIMTISRCRMKCYKSRASGSISESTGFAPTRSPISLSVKGQIAKIYPRLTHT